MKTKKKIRTVNSEKDIKVRHDIDHDETSPSKGDVDPVAQRAIPIEQQEKLSLVSQELLTAVTDIATELNDVKRVLKERLSYDETKEKAFERLYDELDSFKKNTTFNAFRPLFVDMILLFDRIENVRQKISHEESMDVIDFPELLKTLSEEILEILYRNGVDSIRNLSPTFDPKLQHVINVHPTADEADNNTIAQVVRQGFKYDERIIRPEEVIVRRYTAK